MYGGEGRCIEHLVRKLEGKRPVGRPGVDGKLKLKWILNKSNGGDGIGKE